MALFEARPPEGTCDIQALQHFLSYMNPNFVIIRQTLLRAFKKIDQKQWHEYLTL